MKKKTMFFVIVCALVTAVAAFAAACGGEKATLATFDVPESMTVEHMTMCKLPVVAAVDSAGREYVADVSVSDADGMTVSVLNYSFFVEKESPYMAEYSVTVEGERTARTMRIDVTPSQAAFIRLTGKLQYWLEPGAFDVAALDYTVIDADGAEVTGAVIEYAVTDAAGQTVDLSDGKATLAEGTYEVRVTADGEAAVNSIALFVTEKKTDADGRYVYADFADEIVRNLFSTDYTPIYGSVGNGIAWTGMMRSWSETAPSWRIVFLSDGFADFTHGGRVQFDSVMMLDNTGYQVYYYPADGSERQLIGDFPNLGWYQNNTLSFDIAAGGSLEGAYLEFVKTEEGAVWGHAVGNFLISTGYQAEGELQAAVTDGSTVDLDELAVTISDFTGNPADGTRTYAVVRADGSPVTPDSANAFLAEAGNVYTVTVSVGGVAAIPSIQIGCTEERYDEAGRLVYADFGDTADGVPDELDAYQILPDYSNSVMYYELGWEGAKYGLTKYYTAGLSTWSYTFLSDGYADFTNGGVVSFDAVIAAATGAYTAYYYPADGGERITVASFEELGDQEVKNLSFTIPAGGTLVGGRLEFVSEKSDETFVFGNITIDTRLKLAADTQFVGPGDSVDLDTIDIAITNASGEPVTGTKQYTVQTFGGTDVTLGGSTFTPENDTGYTVTVSVNGIETAEPVVVICRDKRTDGEGRIVYADFGNTADGNPDMLDSYLFAASYDNPGYLAIGWQGAKYGMSKAWTLGLTTWSYTFLSDGYADFANGGTVSFDAVIAAATGAYTAYYYPADGGERITVASFDALGDQEVKNLSFTIPAGGTLVGGRLEFVATTADSFAFGNVVIDTRLVLTADTQFIGSGDSVDLDDLDISINNAAGDPVVGTKQYTVKTFAGADVTLDGSTFTPENDTGYTVTVSVNGETAAGTATIVCRDERTDSEGRILYADFGNTADVNPDTLDSYLFDISYTGNTMYYAIGWQGSKYGLCKFWDVQTTTWSYTFLSDGYADFTNGGTVTFDTTEVGNGGAYSVYWYPADGERVTVAELTGVASDVVNTLSFTVPAGGTLVGGRLEFVAAKVDDTFTFGNVVIDTRLVLTADTQFVGSGDSVDLDDLDISINNAAGDPVVGTKQYTVKTFAGTDVTLDGSTFAPENDTGYTVTVSVNGETAAGTATIVCRDERTDGEGRIIYADFGNTADGTPDTLDSYLFAPSYTSDVMYYAIGWQGAKYGLCKFYTVGLSTWSYTFLSDGYADFTNGGTVSFDAVIAAATGAYTAYYYPADGGERITVASFDALGDQEVKNLSFTIPAGGTLVGGRLEFVAAKVDDTFTFGNVVIDTRLVLTADTQFVGSGDSVDLDDLDISINNAAGDPVVGTKQYTVKTFAGTDVTLDGSTFAPENDTGYTVTVSVNGETAAGTATIVCRDERTDGEGRIIYADFGNTADGTPDTLDSYLFAPSYTSDVMYYAIGWQGAKYGLCKFYTVGLSTWSYTFLSDGYADFTNGGTVSFDAVIAAATGAYTAYYYPADGGERITVASFDALGDQEVKNLSFTIPAGGTLVGGRLEFVATTADSFVFGNVVIAENAAA